MTASIYLRIHCNIHTYIYIYIHIIFNKTRYFTFVDYLILNNINNV